MNYNKKLQEQVEIVIRKEVCIRHSNLAFVGDISCRTVIPKLGWGVRMRLSVKNKFL
jgi:hypothetical protein